MFKRKKKEEKNNITFTSVTDGRQKFINDYKKHLKEWMVWKKIKIYNLETNEAEYFLELVPCVSINQHYGFGFTKYQTTNEMFNFIQEGDVVKLIMDKENGTN